MSNEGLNDLKVERSCPRFVPELRARSRRSFGLQRLRRSSSLTASGHSPRTSKLGCRRLPLTLWSLNAAGQSVAVRPSTAIEAISDGFELL